MVEQDLEFSGALPPLVELERRTAGTHLDGEFVVVGRVVCSGEFLDDGAEGGGVGVDEGGVGG